MALCKYCLRPITKSVLHKKRLVKIQNALNSTAKRIANGNNAGPQLSRELKAMIISLRKQKMSYRAISEKLKISVGTVMRHCKLAGLNNAPVIWRNSKALAQLKELEEGK